MRKELRAHSEHNFESVRAGRLELPRREALDPKSSMSTNSITPAHFENERKNSIYSTICLAEGIIFAHFLPLSLFPFSAPDSKLFKHDDKAVLGTSHGLYFLALRGTRLLRARHSARYCGSFLSAALDASASPSISFARKILHYWV